VRGVGGGNDALDEVDGLKRNDELAGEVGVKRPRAGDGLHEPDHRVG
jgi:hypothetical protein